MDEQGRTELEGVECWPWVLRVALAAAVGDLVRINGVHPMLEEEEGQQLIREVLIRVSVQGRGRAGD